MRKSLQESIQKIDSLVKSGNLVTAGRCLKLIRFRKCTHSERLKLSELARRLGDPLKTIRLLNPIVRSSSKMKAKPTPQEEVIYAAALIKIGASSEALGILKKLPSKVVPQSLLYQSHALFTYWQYRDAIPLLKNYIELERDEYQKIVGKVNLAAALVQEYRHSESEPVLRDLLTQTKQLGLKNFEGNTLEIFAQQEIQKRAWIQAETYLDEAHSLLLHSGGLDEFFVRKWKTILALLKSPKNMTAIRDLTRLRYEAQKRKHWETLRECDRFLALATCDETLFLKVYFGTPFSSYRHKLISEFPSKVKIPENYILCFGNGSSEPLRILRGKRINSGEPLKVGQLKHRLLRTLISDFYRPARVASIFSSLYPGELFHPVGSSSRIHSAIKELRTWFQKNKIPLGIKENEGAYQIVPKSDSCAIEIPTPEWWVENPYSRIGELRVMVLDMNFSALTASQRLGVPRRTAHYLLKRGIDSGLIIRMGRGPNTRYKFK